MNRDGVALHHWDAGVGRHVAVGRQRGRLHRLLTQSPQHGRYLKCLMLGLRPKKGLSHFRTRASDTRASTVITCGNYAVLRSACRIGLPPPLFLRLRPRSSRSLHGDLAVTSRLQ